MSNLSEKTASSNSFSILADLPSTGRTWDEDDFGTPVKRIGKRRTGGGKSPQDKSIASKKKDRKNNPPRRNSKEIVLADENSTPESGKENSPETKKNNTPVDASHVSEMSSSPDPPGPSTARDNLTVTAELAQKIHHIPTRMQLLERAGGLAKMFREGNPVDAMASDVFNIDSLTGMQRPQYQAKKAAWEEKATTVIYETGILLEKFEREKVNLWFDLLVRYRNQVPTLFKINNDLYKLV